jgi:hypothetical protein
MALIGLLLVLSVRPVCLVSFERLVGLGIFSPLYFYDILTFTWPKTDFDCTLLYHQFCCL